MPCAWRGAPGSGTGIDTEASPGRASSRISIVRPATPYGCDTRQGSRVRVSPGRPPLASAAGPGGSAQATTGAASATTASVQAAISLRPRRTDSRPPSARVRSTCQLVGSSAANGCDALPSNRLGAVLPPVRLTWSFEPAGIDTRAGAPGCRNTGAIPVEGGGVIQACSTGGGGGGPDGSAGVNAAARRGTASGPAITRAATSETASRPRRARRSRAGRPGRGSPVRRRPSWATTRATWACHTGSKSAGSGPARSRPEKGLKVTPATAGRSASTSSGRWRRPDAVSSRRSTAAAPGRRTGRRPRQSSSTASNGTSRPRISRAASDSSAGSPSSAAMA